MPPPGTSDGMDTSMTPRSDRPFRLGSQRLGSDHAGTGGHWLASRSHGDAPTEDDGFGWPQRDGLKWPHFVLVDVLVR
jgi:hypothetical protein